MRRLTVLTAIAVLALVLPAANGARAADPARPCTADGGLGADWPSYGKDLAGTRNQTDGIVGPAQAASLRKAWAAPVSGFTSTPVIAGRCAYAATSGGDIVAIDLATGTRVWRSPTADPPSPAAIYALAVANGRVHANVSRGQGPVGMAFDADTGARLWASETINFDYRAEAVAGAIVFNGMRLLPTNGPDGDPRARPGIALLDEASGRVLSKKTTIPEPELDAGYAGGGIWATPAVDPEDGYAYVGTANPYSKLKEHRYDNAIVKIDVDPARSTFGSVVDAYKGNVDQYFPGLERQPACDYFGDSIGYHPCCGFSVACVQFDIDFGGSPTMFRNSEGHLLVGEIQKSGIFHTVYADTMQQAWTTLLSTVPPATAGNADSAANDGERVYVAANPGVLYALDVDTGRIRWVAPVGDLASYHPISVSNGVVYALGSNALLFAFDAVSGLPLSVNSVGADAGTFCLPLGGGVAIGRGTVIANCDGTLVAYRPS